MSEAKSQPPGQFRQARRTQRVQIAMPVVIRGTTANRAFEEQTNTSVVNAQGCLVLLSQALSLGDSVSLLNSKTTETIKCRVAFVGDRVDGKKPVGLEFIEPSPRFWRIAFPPEDWDPSERKRPGAAPRSA